MSIDENYPETMIKTLPSPENNFHASHVSLLLSSYQRLLGRPLITFTNPQLNLAEQVFTAKFALISHNTDSDPLFNYANQTALALFEYPWDEFIQLASRYSAEASLHADREKLLALVNTQGFYEDYTGVRMTKSGKRFRIERVTIWNVHDHQGRYYGQAAYFNHWTILN